MWPFFDRYKSYFMLNQFNWSSVVLPSACRFGNPCVRSSAILWPILKIIVYERPWKIFISPDRPAHTYLFLVKLPIIVTLGPWRDTITIGLGFLFSFFFTCFSYGPVWQSGLVNTHLMIWVVFFFRLFEYQLIYCRSYEWHTLWSF